MLLSVYAPKEGEVNIHTENGKIPLTVNARSLFAYVPQGNFLFSGSIYENLTFFMKIRKKRECKKR
jgi:ABC-type bacteriocin/lantibiotic exporter with double-glycine peptidase domain